MNDLKNNPSTAFAGLTGQLSVNSRGEIMRKPGWAKFKQGIPVPTKSSYSSYQGTTSGQYQTGSTSQSYQPTQPSTVINRSNHYDSKTWDSRTNRRTQNP